MPPAARAAHHTIRGTRAATPNLGAAQLITEQHLELVLAAVEAGDADLARTTMAHGRYLLDRIGGESAKTLSGLSTRAKWAVAGLRRGGA